MRIAKNDVDVQLQIPGATIRQQMDFGDATGLGRISAEYFTLAGGVDTTPLFQGLDGNACQCPHWGYVLAGSIHIRYADGTEEINRAGDLYYWPGGHTGWSDEGVTFVELSPAEDLRPVLEHVGAQLMPSA